MIFALAVVVILGIIITGARLAAPSYRGKPSDHFDGRRFLNPGGVRAKGAPDVLKWMLNRKRGVWKAHMNLEPGKHPLSHFREGVRVTFVNHSTFLIQVDGINILTDPVWSRRVSPFRWIGPKRMRTPGLRFEDLPRIHMVLITHNHYDHLDIETMRMVFGAHHPQIVVPLGVKAFFDKHFINGVTELDWWQETASHALNVQCVPAQHFSGRGFTDRDATLWCGYVLTTKAGKIYFAGDTGYNQVMFREIARKSGPFRLAFLPIGAYKPEWFMSAIHVSPGEAVRIHQDVGSQTSIATHFGTFPLADDGQEDPENDLRAALEECGIAQESFLVLKEGEPIVFE